MTKLVLIRHSKSEELNLYKSDFERNLSEKGLLDIQKVKKHYFSEKPFPDLILSSSANRTKQTTELFFDFMDVVPNIVYLDQLYHASASEILDIINRYATNYNFIAVVGHNMGLSELANLLSKKGCSELPTTGYALLEFENGVELHQGNLCEMLSPKSL
jgi:phosphohistidine phosphatase